MQMKRKPFSSAGSWRQPFIKWNFQETVAQAHTIASVSLKLRTDGPCFSQMQITMDRALKAWQRYWEEDPCSAKITQTNVPFAEAFKIQSSCFQFLH